MERSNQDNDNDIKKVKSADEIIKGFRDAKESLQKDQENFKSARKFLPKAPEKVNGTEPLGDQLQRIIDETSKILGKNPESSNADKSDLRKSRFPENNSDNAA